MASRGRGSARPRLAYFPDVMTEHVQVLLFARYAELLGTDSLEIGVGGGATVQDVLLSVRALPGGAELPPRVLCAVNLRQAELGDSVRGGDELALLPPMAGG